MIGNYLLGYAPAGDLLIVFELVKRKMNFGRTYSFSFLLDYMEREWAIGQIKTVC